MSNSVLTLNVLFSQTPLIVADFVDFVFLTT